MAYQLVLLICAFLSLLNVSHAAFGFQTLPKPFTGAQEAAWEAMATRNAEAQLRRSRAAASASLAAYPFSNATANSTMTGSSPHPTSPPLSAWPTHYSVAPKCNASLQNSYHRMVTDIEEYTLTKGAVETAMLQDHESYVTFTLNGPTTYTTIYTRALRPGRPWQAYYPDNYQCCMDCYVYFPQVEVYYWPVPESEETCANSSKPIVTAQAVLPSGAAKTAAARFNTLFSNSSQTGEVSTVNADGFTFVSPSVYVAFGDVSAGDACGGVGQTHTSITLGFAPGELQTVTSLGKNHYDTTLGTRAFDPKNILCPPDFSVEHLFVQQDSLAGIHTYRPRIQIPSALQNLDPKWSSCTVDDYEGIDPPRQLVPAAGWGGDPVATTAASPVQQATPAAMIPSLPKNTGEATGSGPGKSPPSIQIDPPNANPSTSQDPSSSDSNPPVGQNPSNAAPPQNPGKSNTGSSNGAGPNNQPKPKSPNNQDINSSGDRNNGNAQGGQDVNPNPAQTGSGANPPADIPHRAAAPEPAQPAIVVQGQTIKQGAPPVTIGGKPVVYSKGSVYVNGAAAPAPTVGNIQPSAPQPEQNADPVELGGFKFTPTVQPGIQDGAAKPALAKPAVVVQSQTVRQGEPPITINGNKVVYSGDSVHIGSTAVPVVPAGGGQPPKPVTINGMTFSPEAVPPAVANAGSSENQGNQARPVVMIKGQTVTENGSPATINGKPVVYSGGAVYAAGTKVTVPTVTPGQPPSPVNVAGLNFTPQPIQSHGNGPIPAVLVAGHTLTEGAPAVSVNGAKLAYSSGSVYVNGKAAPLPTPAPQPAKQANQPVVVEGLSFYAAAPAKQQAGAPWPIATVAGHTIVQMPAGGVAFDDTILTPGSPSTTISGTPISLNPTALVVGSKTLTLSVPPTPTAVATVAGQTIYQDAAGAVVVAGKTLIPEGPGITVSGTRYSLASTAVIAGTSTIPLLKPAQTPTMYDAAGDIFTIAPDGGLVIGPGATVGAGGPAVTVSGTPYSLITSAGSTMLVEGTRTLPLAPAASPTAPFPLEIFSSTIIANADGDYVLSGKTIIPDGPAVTVSGTRISLGHVGGVEVLVVGTSTTMVDAGIPTSQATRVQSSEGGGGALPTAAITPTGSAGVGGSSIAAPTSDASSNMQVFRTVACGLLVILLIIMEWL